MDRGIRKSCFSCSFRFFKYFFISKWGGEGDGVYIKMHGMAQASYILVILLISWSKIFLKLLVSPLLYRNIDLPRIQTTNTERAHHRKAPQSFWRPPFWHLGIFCTAVCTKQLSWSLYDVKLRSIGKWRSLSNSCSKKLEERKAKRQIHC